jgi:hypothetical protein
LVQVAFTVDAFLVEEPGEEAGARRHVVLPNEFTEVAGATRSVPSWSRKVRKCAIVVEEGVVHDVIPQHKRDGVKHSGDLVELFSDSLGHAVLG